jgi:outer membrane lipoprotein-sorting protein
MKFKLPLFLLLLPLAALAGGAPSLQPVANPQPLLEDLQRKMASVRTVYLEFTQEEHYVTLFDQPQLSQGVMLLGHPDLIRWEYTRPFQSILLGNHKSVAQFEFNNGQWKKLDLGFPQMLRRVMEQMSLMHQGKLDALTGDYSISVATNDSEAVLTLVPKDKSVRQTMPALEIHLAPDLSATREVVMRESGGDFRRIIFSREVRDATFPEGSFDQAKPLDLDAIKKAVDHGT